jgi:hypothetical protein
MENNEKLFSQKEITMIAIDQCRGYDEPYSKIWNDAIHAVLEAITREADNAT